MNETSVEEIFKMALAEFLTVGSSNQTSAGALFLKGCHDQINQCFNSQSLTIRKQQVEIEELRKQRNKYAELYIGAYEVSVSVESDTRQELEQADTAIEAKKAEVK